MSLQTVYEEQVRSKLQTELGVKNPMAVPKVEKVVVDMGIGEAAGNREVLDKAREELSLITGQGPQVRGARVAIAGFGIRRGSPVGLRVTLRGSRMWAFLEKLFRVVLPRLRDFRGAKENAFDGRGNYTLGLAEHTIFPEVDVGRVGKGRGIGVTIVTTARTNEQARRLLEELGMPFEKGRSG